MTYADALAAADELAEQLTDPHSVLEPDGGFGRTRPQSLVGGAAGIALLHVERARSGQGNPAIARRWLALAHSDEISMGDNATLFYGAPALGFLLRAATPASRQLSALDRLDAATITITQRRLLFAHTRLVRCEPPVLAEFDLIRGLTGLGAYHLRAHPEHGITSAVVRYLVALTEPLSGTGRKLPGWWTLVSPNGEPTPEFPGGHGNLGMSHGIAAPLALLSLAALRGVQRVDGLAHAIDRICEWLETWRQPGPWWPGYVTIQQGHTGHTPATARQAPRWCYGTVGLARALQLAAMARGDTARKYLAETAMLQLLRDDAELDRVYDSGLCHGFAGILQTAWRMAADADTAELATELPRVARRLVTRVSTGAAKPEFFDGTAGIALALQTFGSGTAPSSGWDACLLAA